jgi:preprotein translocase subunit YajC
VVIAIYLVILVAAFYFLIVRPQRRNAMIRRQLLSAVEVGDEIVTSGGLYGTVLVIDDDTLEVEIASGVVVKIARGAVAARITAPSDADAADAADELEEYDGDLEEVEEADDDGDARS